MTPALKSSRFRGFRGTGFFSAAKDSPFRLLDGRAGSQGASARGQRAEIS